DSLDDPATAELVRVLPDVRGLRVLDMACGHGRITRELLRRGAEAVGVDLSQALIDKARRKQPSGSTEPRFVVGDVCSPSILEGERFSGVVCNHALADIDDLDGALASVVRLLDEGGFFAFSLLHPCFPGWGENAPSSWPPGQGYYREGWWLAHNPGFRGKVGANHRKISTYLNSIVIHGLQVEVAEEPTAPFGDWPTDKPAADHVPVFLVMRCRKR
ncbi:MAG: class I SAM-dependent methyltransferase, partial [Anaerolineaceae bacterium]